MIDAASRMYSTTMEFILNPTTLKRVTSTTLYGNTYTEAEVMSDLVKASFNEVEWKRERLPSSLQNILVQRLITIATDAKAYATSSKAAAYYSLKGLKTL